MKTHSALYALAVWALTTTASYGQNNAIETGSAEAERALRQYEQGRGHTRSETEKGKRAETAKGKPPVNILKDCLPREPRDWAAGNIGLLGRNAKVIQVIGKDKALISVSGLEVSSLSRLAMLSGFSTKGMTDGSVWTIDEPVEITGTTTYTTVDGSTSTVLVLECNSGKIKAIKAKLEADQEALRKATIERAEAEKEHKEAIEAAKWRTWSDTSGNHKTEAKFSGLLAGKVKLTKRDGSSIQVPLDQLSDEDREWISTRRK